MRICVYSCIAGGYDDPAHLLGSFTAPGLQYVLFTDAPPTGKCGAWDVRPLPWLDRTPQRSSRWPKIMAHAALPDVDASIWIDGNQQIKPGVDLVAMAAEALSDHDLATFWHPCTSCAYAEAEICERLGKDEPAPLRAQATRYRQLGYPRDNGLAELACIVRRHAPLMARFNRHWWAEYAAGSCRDQISFPFVAWRNDLAWRVIPGQRTDSQWFEFRDHEPCTINLQPAASPI